MTYGSNHIRYVGPRFTIRLTTDAPIDYVLDRTTFILHEPMNFVLGPDETLADSVSAILDTNSSRPERYWRAWVTGWPFPSNGRKP